MNVNIKGHIIRPGLPTVYYTKLNYTVSGSVGYIVILADCSISSINIILETATVNTDCIVIKRIDSSSNALTVTPSGTENIDNSTVVSINVQYTSITLVSNGSSGWNII